MSELRAVLVGMVPTGNLLACAYLKAAADADPALRGRVATDIRSFERYSDAEAVARDVLSLKPDLVGISTYIWNSQTSLALARVLRRRRPGLFIVLGGPQASWATEEWFSRAPIDACAVGEGEDTFRELLAARLDRRPLAEVAGLVWREGRAIRRGRPRAQIEDLSRVASPYLSGIADPAAHRSLSLETSRGCPFDCSFCDWQKNQRVRHFPLDRVVEEVRLIARRRPDAALFFTDADLFLHKERAKRLLPALLKAAEDTALTFDFETNLGPWDDEMLRLADHPRVSLSCGVQSLNPAALRAANRDMGPFRPELTESAFRRRARLAPRARVSPELIFGMPGDDPTSWRGTLEWALGISATRVITTPFLVLPGSAFHEDPARWGISHDPLPPYRLLSSATFREEDMAAARRASSAVALGLSLGWHAAEALRALARLAPGRSPAPTLDVFEDFCAELEADGRFPWAADARERLQSSLNFNLSDPISPSPESLLSRRPDPEPEIARDLPEVLLLLERRASPLPGSAGLTRFLRAARSRFERRRLSRLSSFRRLLEAQAGPGGRWLVAAPDEDRGLYERWSARGKRVSLVDPGGDALQAESGGALALRMEDVDALGPAIAESSREGELDGVLIAGAWSYLTEIGREAVLAAAARAVRDGGALIVVDDGLGYAPFTTAGPGDDSEGVRAPVSSGWSARARPASVRLGGANWSVARWERLPAAREEALR